MYKYKVINTFPGEENGNHDYDIIVETIDAGEKYTLKRSQSSIWSENARGETVCAILDDGDSIKLSDHITKDLGYDTACELFILMSFINKTEPLSLYKGIIEKVEEVYEI